LRNNIFYTPLATFLFGLFANTKNLLCPGAYLLCPGAWLGVGASIGIVRWIRQQIPRSG